MDEINIKPDDDFKRILAESFIIYLLSSITKDHKIEIVTRLLNQWSDYIRKDAEKSIIKNIEVESKKYDIGKDELKIIFDIHNIEKFAILEEYKTELLQLICSELSKIKSGS